MKKLLSILLAALMLGAIFATTTLAFNFCYEDAFATLKEVVAEFNQSHGGTGELIATAEGSGEYLRLRITGEIVGVTRGITFPSAGVPIVWQARLSGDTQNGEALVTAPQLIVETGGEIIASDRAIEGTIVQVNGGLIVGQQAIYSDGHITISSGMVSGDLTQRGMQLNIESGVVEGSISLNPDVPLNIFGGMVSAPFIDAGWRVCIENDAQVKIEDITGLENSWVSIASTASTNFEDRLNNVVLQIDDVAIVLGSATLDYGFFEIESQQTLYIPRDASLTIKSMLHLNEGTVVIDGTLILPEYFNPRDWNGYITGDNSGDLAGSWPRPLSWWQRLPNWIQWVLRWVFFGWIWM